MWGLFIIFPFYIISPVRSRVFYSTQSILCHICHCLTIVVGFSHPVEILLPNPPLLLTETKNGEIRPMVTNVDNRFSIQEYANIKNVHINTVRNWIKDKKIEVTMISNKWYIHDTNIVNNQEYVSEKTSTNNDNSSNTIVDNSSNNQDLVVGILQDQIEHLKEELKEANDKIKRSDMMIMKLTNTVENQQLQLTEAQTPFWKKLFGLTGSRL